MIKRIICLIKGHDWLIIDSDRLYHEKGEQLERRWYSGRLFQCKRCNKEIFQGDCRPYHTEKSVKGA